jgi:hypothetical protein
MDDDAWSPPSAERVRKRLMMLWANAGRSYLEVEYQEGPGSAPQTTDQLRAWVLAKLADEATAAERERHARPLGSCSTQELIDNSWDTPAASMLVWGLGVIDRTPEWEVGMDWHEATHEFFDFPDPATWPVGLAPRSPAEMEREAMAYEARYWRIRGGFHDGKKESYVKKLLRRSPILGHTRISADGDFALSDGGSFANLPEERRSEIRSTVMERLHALIWLCGQEESWDDITTDTIVSWLWDEKCDGDKLKGGTGICRTITSA